MYHPYRPMHKVALASEAEIAAMHERLKRKVNAGAGDSVDAVREVPQVPTSSAPAPRKPLEWDKPKSPDATGLKTKCGRYSCAKITTNGKLTYELWKLAPGGGWFRQLNAGLDNFLQVQKLAQIDADKGTP